jgi:hypothetical protein
MQMQRNQFLALNFDPATKSPFKIKTPGGQQALETMELANEACVKIETINFIKPHPAFTGSNPSNLPPSTSSYARWARPTTPPRQVSSASPAKPAGRTCSKGSTTRSRPSGDTTRQAKNKYTTHKDSFHDDADFVAWWTTLLLLQTTQG